MSQGKPLARASSETGMGKTARKRSFDGRPINRYTSRKR